MMRAAAAAAGGHAGAQLAVMGEGAVGARVSVWWPIDGKWFNGVVSLACLCVGVMVCWLDGWLVCWCVGVLVCWWVFMVGGRGCGVSYV